MTKKYDEEFKKTVVKLYESGKGIMELSREYGVLHSKVRNWINKYQTITTNTGETEFKILSMYSTTFRPW